MDLQGACSGFVYALSAAKAFIEANMYQNVLVVASEKMTSYIDYTDRNTCVLFGDGAAAAVITNKGEGLAIDKVCLGANGKLAHLITVPAGGTKLLPSSKILAQKLHFFRMEGKEVFKHAVRQMENAAQECLSALNLTTHDIDWLDLIKRTCASWMLSPKDLISRLKKCTKLCINTATPRLPACL